MQMTINDVADYFKVSRRTIYRWLEKGIIPAYKVNDQYRFVFNEVVDWATANRVNSSSTLNVSHIKKQKPKYPLYAASQSGGIYYRIEGNNKEELFRNVLNLMKLPHSIDKNHLLTSLTEREKIASTGIGNGIALPELKNPNEFKFLNSMLNICFLENSLDFNSLDNKPVKCLILLFCTDFEIYLSMKTRLNFLLKNETFMNQIELCGTRDSILHSVKNAEAELKNGDLTL